MLNTYIRIARVGSAMIYFLFSDLFSVLTFLIVIYPVPCNKQGHEYVISISAHKLTVGRALSLIVRAAVYGCTAALSVICCNTSGNVMHAVIKWKQWTGAATCLMCYVSDPGVTLSKFTTIKVLRL